MAMALARHRRRQMMFFFVWLELICGIDAAISASREEPAHITALFREEPCPVKTEGLASQNTGGNSDFTWESKYPGTVSVFWVDPNGREVAVGTVSDAHPYKTGTFVGHAFRAYAFPENVLIAEHVVKTNRDTFAIADCGGTGAKHRDGRLSRGSSALVVVDGPCDGPSKTWHCVHTPKAWPQDQYGFQPGMVPQDKKLYQSKDVGYTSHRNQIIRYTEGPGYIIAKQPAAMHEMTLAFLNRMRAEKKVLQNERIEGNYMNDEWLNNEVADLDRDWQFRLEILQHLLPIMEAWSNRTLMHTDTYGIRIYKRDSMLLDHIDRQGTHVISAVVQVDQDCDEGWPLTVEDEDGTKQEIYLQAGDIALYEGSRIFHGRSKVSKCNFMANLFSHFRPIDYKESENAEL